MGSTSVPIDDLDRQDSASASSVPIDDLDTAASSQQLTPNASYDPLASAARTSSDPITAAAQGRPRLGAAFSDVVGTHYTQPDAQTQAAVARLNSPQAAASQQAGMPLAGVGGKPQEPQGEEYIDRAGLPHQTEAVPEASGWADPLLHIGTFPEPLASGLSDIHEASPGVTGLRPAPADEFGQAKPLTVLQNGKWVINPELGNKAAPVVPPDLGRGPRVAQTPEELAAVKANQQKAIRGTAEVLDAAGRAGMIAAPASAIEAPLATAFDVAAGSTLSPLAGKAVEKMGGTPDEQALARAVWFFLPTGRIVARGIGLRTGSAETPMGDFSAAEALGGRVKGGIASTPDVLSGRFKFGNTQFEVNVPRNRPAPPPEPSEAAKALMDFEQHTGNPDFQPQPPPPVDKGPQHLTPDIVQGVSDTIMQAPAEKRPDMMVEAHANMSRWMLSRGTFTGPDHKIYTIDNEGQAKRLASKFINDEVDRKDAEQEQAAKATEEAKQPAEVAPVSGKPPAGSGMTTDTAAVENVAQKAQLHPEQKPAVMVKEEPPKQAAALAKPPAPVQPQDVAPIGTKDKESDRTILQPSTDVMQNERLASQAAPELATKLSHIAAGVDGATFDRIRPQKELQRVDEKVDEAGKPPETVPDYLAAQIAADSPQAKDSLIQELQKNFKVVSVEDSFLEGRPKLAGYPSANVQVMMGNGLTAEVQIVPREIQESANESHKYYTAGREAELRGDHAEKDKQFAEATKLHNEAMDKFRERNGIEQPTSKARTYEDVQGDIDRREDELEKQGISTSHLYFAKDAATLKGYKGVSGKDTWRQSPRDLEALYDERDKLGSDLLKQNTDELTARLQQSGLSVKEATRILRDQYSLKRGETTGADHYMATEHTQHAALRDPRIQAKEIYSKLADERGIFMDDEDDLWKDKKATQDAIKATKAIYTYFGGEWPQKDNLLTEGKSEPQHEFASTQINVDPQSDLGQAHAEAVAKIPQEHVGKEGIEKTPHVTIRYGLKNDSPAAIEKIKQAASRIQPFDVPMGKTEVFPATKHSSFDHPVVARLKTTPELKALRDAIEGAGAFKEDNFPEYKPHVTLAYIKPEFADQYKGGSQLEGHSVPVKEIVVTKRDGSQEVIPLGGQAGHSVPIDELEAAGHSVPLDELDKVERRTNPVERKRVADMKPEERAHELLTSELTGLPNKRAFAEDVATMGESHPHVGYADIDDFKGFNTELGHEGVDEKVLPKIGEVFHRATGKELGGSVKVYHRSGDEFLFRAKDAAAISRVVDRANKELENMRFTADSPDDTIHEKIGAGLSHGTGKDAKSAERAAELDKQRRKAAGLRSGARDIPERVGQESAQGKQAIEVRNPSSTPIKRIEQTATPDVRKSAAERFRDRVNERKRSEGGFAALDIPETIVRGVADPVINFIRDTSKATPEVSSLDDRLFTLSKQYEASVLRAIDLMKQAGSLTTAEDQEAIYHHLEQPSLSLDPRQQSVLDSIVAPLMKQSSVMRAELKDAGIPMGNEGYVHRVVQGKNSQLERAMRRIQGTGKGNVLSTSAASLKGRKMFSLEDKEGKRRVVAMDGGKITGFENGRPIDMGSSPRLSPGDTFIDKSGKRWTLAQAITKEIESSTALKYYKNALASAVTDYLQLLRAKRANDALEALKADPGFNEVAFKSENGSMPPDEEWRPVNLPQFRNYYFEPRVAEVLDRFAKELHPDPPSVLEKIGDFMTSTLLLNPVRHVYNIGNHWLVERGVSGAFNPFRWPSAYRAGIKATKAVVNQSGDFLEALDKGAPMMSHRTDLHELNQHLFQTIVGYLEKNPGVMDKIAEFSGYSPSGPTDTGVVNKFTRGTGLRLLNNVRLLGQKAMWMSNDIFMLQSAYEKMDRGMTFEDAMDQTTKHIPDYRVPTRILDSKMMADLMSSRLASMFGRYHYGVWKSYWEMGRESMSPDSTPAERLRGLDHLAMLAFLTFIAYQLWDEVLKKLTHDHNAKMVRSGASAVPAGIQDVVKGEKPASSLIRQTFTPAIFPQTVAEILFNRDFYTGAKVYKDHGSTKKQAKDIGKHVLNTLGPVQQYNTAERSSKPVKNLLLNQVGVNTNSSKRHK